MMTREETAYQAEVLRQVAELLRYPAGQLCEGTARLRELFVDGSQEHSILGAMQDALGKATAVELQVDYTALLIGSMQMLAVPYASYYLDGERQLGGPSMVAVSRQYAKHGLSLADGPKQPADHLATMLEFASLLLRRSLECPADGSGAARSESLRHEAAVFYASYVAGWTAEFAESLGANARTAFYRELAGLLPFVLLEDSFLLESLESSEGPGAGCPDPCSAPSADQARREPVLTGSALERS